MNNFHIEKLYENKYPIWDIVVDNSKNGSFLHKINFFTYHIDRFLDESVIIYKKNKPVAIFPCNAQNNNIISHSGLTYAGLIFIPDLHASDIIYIFQHLSEYYKDKKYSKIIYKAVPYIFSKFPAEEDLYALFRLKAKIVRRDISSVIFQENQLKLSDSRKSTIKKAIKNKLVLSPNENLEAFYNILSSVLQKFNVTPTHSLQELLLLKSRFPENIKCFTIINCENEVIAGTIIFDFGRVVHTQYMASSEKGRETGALDYLLSELIFNIYKNKKYFSFGISTENSGLVLNNGLISQKEGFGARGICHDFYEWDLNND
ncbi:GNAT family acetyltransferase [Xenorhabdus bovienii]|nr:GNAT family acetyltransferase [Xenorhabdus bovienii]